MSGHPAPRRETGQRAAQCLAARTRGGGGLGTDAELDGALIAAPEVSPALKARDYKGPSSDGDGDGDGAPLIAHTLRGEGFDASEDGTGRGTPLVPVAVDHYNGALTGDVAATLSTGGATTTGSGPSVMVPVAQPYTLAIRGRGETHNLEYRQDGTANALITPNGGRGGIGVGAIAHAFDARQSDVIQYGDRTGPLDTDGHSVAVAFTQNQRDEVREVGVVGALAAEPGMKQQTYLATGATPMQVRRLTPRECERLQGFPDDYTAITWRGRPASECPDGPRYKALGNSMAVPVMRYLAERIAAVEAGQ
jgi:DNA (cytosine-5)-methyltransferase 1